MAIAPTGAIYKALSYDGASSRDFGIYITGTAVYNAPERDVEMISIPGRNGTLAMDHGRFENITVSYPAGIFAETESDYANAVSDFRNYVCSRKGYCRLTDEYNPTEFRLAIYRSGLEVETKQRVAGRFEIQFDCKPQRFLTSGETSQTFTANGTITNPTYFEAAPFIAVVGSGTVTIGSYSFQIVPNVGTVYIDADIVEAYTISGTEKISQNKNIIYTNHKPPRIEPGTVSVTLGTGITSVTITPRWWRI